MTCREHYQKQLDKGKITFPHKEDSKIKCFQSYELFKLPDNRRKSCEYDFGVFWHRALFPAERWRISWIASTGELYAVCLSYFKLDSVDFICILLGCIPDLKAVRERMQGCDIGLEGNVLDVFFPFIDWDCLEVLGSHIGLK